MKKSTIMVKKLLALFLIVLISIESFGAVVGDNDGMAFVTKVEFEALKDNFDSQIDNYEASIDRKIDGAIASYLAGIRLNTKETLTNIYENLGGEKIRFGSPNITPTTKPVTGYALFFENGDKYGVSVTYIGGGNYAIRDPKDSRWTNNGGQVLGKVLIYKEENNRNNRFLDCYRETVVQACYAGGWWTGGTAVRKCTVSFPFGQGSKDLGMAITDQSVYSVDFQQAVYREYKPVQIDLTNWTAAWDVDGSADKVFISEENYKHVSELQTNLGTRTTADGGTIYNGQATTGGSAHDDTDVTFTNIRINNWKIDDNQKYESLTPGFYYRSQYDNSLFGGVQFFETTDSGKVKIDNLKFMRSTSGNVYFAISTSPFANQENLVGNVRFDSITGATIDDEASNRYRAISGSLVTIEFDIDKDKTYYIKCQPATSKTSSNDVYCGIANGTTIEAMYE